MINQILLICYSVLIYEFIRYVKLSEITKSNLEIYKKLVKLLKSKKGSDFRIEKLVVNYSKLLLLVSIKIFAILISIIILLLILNLLSNSFLNLIMSIFGIIEISMVLIIYHLLRKKFYAKL